MGYHMLPYYTVEGDMMQPFSFNLKDRYVLFIGGGKVAQRKITALLNENCRITVIAPEVTKEISESGMNVILRGFEESDITEKYALVFCCTNDRQINSKAADLSKKLRIPVNIADNPEASDFHTTSVIRSGDFVISISTEGKDPSKTKKMREKLENLLKNI
ncbi:bifunctional precorrin-2 dehydrogenase/sirohydrochlorin ferrochelatase [Seleniivibrio sp.]|uniref:precorrin-2 dehydrogenase/sirohydrochlorin ferrochelatase family protein n=1 Tax=Seleniivibrio sp. TaxID=2898801 RepID=UPI0025E83400|nr:bifunctional precorrin-2 dehydrogenase/sirohydrochlorin ferrochelatase [Seleniivibrio sp.]MCD8554336.1 bifunctional precorrin-2 dehydrogenase/sirohydrochlorin ferrochelatase [Seleniivibrio sp.]